MLAAMDPGQLKMGRISEISFVALGSAGRVGVWRVTAFESTAGEHLPADGESSARTVAQCWDGRVSRLVGLDISSASQSIATNQI